MAFENQLYKYADPHSYSRPDRICVTHIDLKLNVNFFRKILHGQAILTIVKKIPSSYILILDSYELVIKNVTNCFTNAKLEYTVELGNIYGKSFTIKLPEMQTGDRCDIRIEYETSPSSPALYWLTPEQTTNGKHPFLLCNNQYTYARSVFPCQDTPSVKFTYSATIKAPIGFSVLMSATLLSTNVCGQECEYIYSQMIPVPSYAVVIAVGVLEAKKLNSKIDVRAENENSLLSDKSIRLIEQMLQSAENICGIDYPWESLILCVLPPSTSHFWTIECPCLIFVSPLILGGDISLINSVALNIAQNWTGILVTCANYKNIWLNKSFSLFIYSKILSSLVTEDMMSFIMKNCSREMERTRQSGLNELECLLPSGELSIERIKHVPYEKGLLLLEFLENHSSRSEFETFLRSYLKHFRGKSIVTEDFISYLMDCFSNKTNLSEIMDWNFWFRNPNFSPKCETSFLRLERVCNSLAEKWINMTEFESTILDTFFYKEITVFCDLQKMHFLNYLYSSLTMLSGFKLQIMSDIYEFDKEIGEIRFCWLSLCVKSCWIERARDALDFAFKFGSPHIGSVIFNNFAVWSFMHRTVNLEYAKNNHKILEETRETIAAIIHVDE